MGKFPVSNLQLFWVTEAMKCLHAMFNAWAKAEHVGGIILYKYAFFSFCDESISTSEVVRGVSFWSSSEQCPDGYLEEAAYGK